MSETPHNLFLDDSGTKEYALDQKYSTKGGKTPYFAFGGLIVTPAVAGQINREMRRLKMQHLGAIVEIKANWLKRPEERRKRYLEPLGVSEADLTRLVDDLYKLIADVDCTLLGCIVNKAEVQEQYLIWHYAPSIAYDCVLQRTQLQMESVDGFVHVTIDDMSGATPKGSQYKENLKRQHRLLRASGSHLRRGMKFDRIRGQSFSASDADERLQLADLVAYSIYRQFIDHGPDWEIPGKSLPVYEYLGRIAHKFRNLAGRIQGYGIVKFPMGNRVQWAAKVPPIKKPRR